MSTDAIKQPLKTRHESDTAGKTNRYNARMSAYCRFILPIFCLVALAVTGPAWAADKKPSLRIESDQPALTQNLEVSLDLRNESCESSSARQRLVERNLRRSAHQAAQAVGFYQAQFSISFTETKDCWQALMVVKAGQPVIVTELHVQIEGAAQSDPEFIQLLKNSPLKEGQILRHDHYQSLRDSLLRLASQRGYFDHQLSEHRLEVEPDIYSAKVFLTLNSGPRYRFGEFTLDQDVLYPERALRYLRFSPGDDWDTDLLLESQQALLGSRYFTTARMERGNADPETLQVPATLYLSTRPRRAWMTGVGASTDTGPRVRLGYEDRYLNRQGHRWQVDSELSPMIRSTSGRYEIPLRDPTRDRLVFSTGYRLEETDSSESEKIRLGASLISGISNGWMLTRSIDYERENFTVAAQTETTELVMPGVQVQKSRGDNPIYPRRGWKLGLSLRGTHPSISSTESFLQSRLWAKAILPIGPSRLLARFDVAQTAVTDVTTLPATVRFFAGGDTSVRGFAYQSLGPKDAAGEVIGGRHLAVGGLELDFALSKRWHPAVFVDAGNAFNDPDELDIRYSAGAGIRWRSPLGPIRVDLARPVDVDRPWRLHLSMGPDL